MQTKSSARIPSYRLHKPTGLGVVRLSGRDIYLGKHGTRESQTEYRRVVAEWLASSKLAPLRSVPDAAPQAGYCVAELVLAYLEFAKGYYVKNGKPTGEIANLRDAAKPLAALYSTTPVAEFGPAALKAVRQAMIDAGLCRGVLNARVNRVRRIFKWGVENEVVPAAVLQGLQAVAPLKRGRCDVRDTDPVAPVADDVVLATKRAAPPTLAAMIHVHRLTGMRPGELVIMRTCDLDTSKPVWEYRPSSHKTEHHGHSRVIYLGPKAQRILAPYLKSELEAFIFCPEEVTKERRDAAHTARKTPITPCERKRMRKERPRRKPGARYTTTTYARAIAYACDVAFPHPTFSALRQSKMTPEQRREWRAWQTTHRWSPNQLRHSAATELRKQFGIEAAQLVLGHSSVRMTEIYAQRNSSKAANVMATVG